MKDITLSGHIDLAILLSALFILEREAGKEEKNNKKHIFSFLQLINTSFSSLKSHFLTKAFSQWMSCFIQTVSTLDTSKVNTK